MTTRYSYANCLCIICWLDNKECYRRDSQLHGVKLCDWVSSNFSQYQWWHQHQNFGAVEAPEKFVGEGAKCPLMPPLVPPLLEGGKGGKQKGKKCM